MFVEILNADRPLTYEVYTGPKGDKGEPGSKVIAVNFVKTLEDGSYLYEQVCESGDKFTFISPIGPEGKQGEQGETGSKIVSTTLLESTEAGNTYKQTFDDGTYNTFIAPRGPQGIQGNQGLKGDKGDQGAKGDQGLQGIQGETGPKGDTGAKGDKGDKGDTGSQGIQGIQGEKGEQGIQGETGPKGDKGDKGDKGADGAKIVSTTFVEETTEGYKYKQEFDDGTSTEFIAPKGPKGDIGETGAQGEKGDKGADGAKIVSTELISSTDEGNTYRQNFDDGTTSEFLAPKGPKGDQGIQGETGAQGIQGEAGAKGDKGDKGDSGYSPSITSEPYEETGATWTQEVTVPGKTVGGDIVVTLKKDGVVYDQTTYINIYQSTSDEQVLTEDSPGTLLINGQSFTGTVTWNLPASYLARSYASRIFSDSEKTHSLGWAVIRLLDAESTSITATLEEDSRSGNKITIQNESSSNDFIVYDGKQGKNGADGKGFKDMTVAANITYDGDVEGGSPYINAQCSSTSHDTDQGISVAATITFNAGNLKGEKGDTPVKGTDYWTESDKTEMVNDVLAQLENFNTATF